MAPAIRPCQASDLLAVRDLLRQLDEAAAANSPLDLPLLTSIFEYMADRPDAYLNLIAEDAGRPIGFISVVFYKTLYHRVGTAMINELVVDRDARGGGVGRALMAAVVAAAAERGMDEVEVGTERSNTAAQRFYHRCGFDEEYVLLGMEFD